METCKNFVIITLCFCGLLSNICDGSVVPEVSKLIEDFISEPKYLHYPDVSALFKNLSNTYPDLARVHSIGKSVEDRDLLVLEVSENVAIRSIGEPMFKFVANMHGDETVGRQMVLYLAEYLLRNYGKDERVTRIVNTTDIFLMPSLNPDGFEHSSEGLCLSKPGYVGRENVNHQDLNRDFPDQFDNDTHPSKLLEGRQKETVAAMTWIVSNPFVLSGNLHSGALVASFPYDNSGTGRECCEESRAPDHFLFHHLALMYSQKHQEMYRGDACPPEKFKDGVTNGANWYEVKGGMQDFNYVHSNCLDVTFELGCCKYPLAEMLPSEWRKNKEPMLSFMEQVHIGIKGLVTDEHGAGVAGAQVTVEKLKRVENLEGHNVTTSSRGEYWRMLLPGEYAVTVSAWGYLPAPSTIVTVAEGPATWLNFTLHAVPPPEGN